MPFTDKMIDQIKKPTLKAFAFKGDPSMQEIKILGNNFWDFPNATKRVLRDGTVLYLVQREPTNSLYLGDLSSALENLDDVDDVDDMDALTEKFNRMVGGKKRKSKKSRKSRKSKKSKKSRKTKKEVMGWQKW